jgi:hypothetical protein
MLSKRQKAERSIVRRFVTDAIKVGYLLNVNNGGESYELSAPTNEPKVILEALFATDEEHLYCFHPDQPRPFGFVYLVYGNDGYNVISDYSVNLESVMDGANKMADRMADQA